MIKLSPNLVFKGQCEAAFKFYERCLDAKITFMLRWRDSPMADQAPTEWRDKILHASLKVGDDVLEPVFWRSCRSVRHTLVDQLRGSEVGCEPSGAPR